MNKNALLAIFATILSGCATRDSLHLYEGNKRPEAEIAKVSIVAGAGFARLTKINDHSLSMFEVDAPFVYVLPGDNTFFVRYKDMLIQSVESTRSDVHLEAGHTYAFHYTLPNDHLVRFQLIDYGKSFPEACHITALATGGVESEETKACIEKFRK